MRVRQIDFLAWNTAPWKDALADAIEQYLARSGEEITREEQWQLVHLALMGAANLALFVAESDDQQFLGYAILNVAAGTQVTGPLANIWQTYVKPGAAKVEDLLREAWPVFTEWASARNCRWVCLQTSRGAFVDRIVQMGFDPWFVMFRRPLAS